MRFFGSKGFGKELKNKVRLRVQMPSVSQSITDSQSQTEAASTSELTPRTPLPLSLFLVICLSSTFLGHTTSFFLNLQTLTLSFYFSPILGQLNLVVLLSSTHAINFFLLSALMLIVSRASVDIPNDFEANLLPVPICCCPKCVTLTEISYCSFPTVVMIHCSAEPFSFTMGMFIFFTKHFFRQSLHFPLSTTIWFFSIRCHIWILRPTRIL